MKDVFETINTYNSRFNLFRDAPYLRKVAFYFSFSMLFFWFVFGFDSGVGILEMWVNDWKFNYSAYGKSLHFSAFVIYGFLYIGLSKYLERLGLQHSKNVFYSACLSVFNIGIFEIWYMGTFATFQMQRSLTEWFINDFWEVPVIMNFLFLILGSVTMLSFYVDGFKLNDNKVVGRLYRFKPNLEIIMLLLFTALSIYFWVYYPFPTETIRLNGWQNSKLFPQTHYAYVNAELYIPNDILHSVNLIVKVLFASTQFYILTRFKKVSDSA